MKNNVRSTPSSLRQQLDILGAQFLFETKVVDPVLVMTCLKNVSMISSDTKTPIPDDVFAPGLHDELMRIALAGLCIAMMQVLNEQLKKAMPRTK